MAIANKYNYVYEDNPELSDLYVDSYLNYFRGAGYDDQAIEQIALNTFGKPAAPVTTPAATVTAPADTGIASLASTAQTPTTQVADTSGIASVASAVQTPTTQVADTGGIGSLVADTSTADITQAADTTQTAATQAQVTNPYDAVTAAWNSGDYAATNAIIASSGLTAKDIQNYYKLDDATMDWVLSQGIKTADQTQATDTTQTQAADTTAANIVTYNDGTTYDATQLSSLTNQITQLTDALGTDKLWKGAALNAGQGANIGFDANTGAQILGTDTITNKQQVALDMAAGLADAGVTNLNQIGIGDIKGDVSVRADVDVNGDPTGTYSKFDPKTGTYVPMNAAEVAQIREVTVGDGENVSQALVTTGVTGTGLINKTTGQTIGDGSGTIGKTYTGDGFTEYKVQIDPTTGLPIFYTVGGSSNDLANLMTDLGPIGQIGLAIATGGLSIPQQIAANFAIQALSGKDIGDAIKSAAVSFAGSQIPGMDFMQEGASFIKDLGLSKELTDTLTKGLQNAATSTVGAVLTGQDAGDAFVRGFTTGGANGAVSAMLGNVEGFGDLTAAQKSMVTNLVTGAVSGKPLDQIVINNAINLANAAIAEAKGTSTEAALTKAGLTKKDDSIADILDSQLTIDASGARDIDAAAKFASDQGYNKFTFDGKTYTLGNNNAERTIALFEADALKANTAANLAGSDMAGVDTQTAANAAANAANVVKIGNAEADTEQEAAALAKARDPNATQFEYGGKTYTMGVSNTAVTKALDEAKAEELKNNIANAATKDEAYKLARENLGAGKTFTWGGKTFSTNTAQEQLDALNAKNLSTKTDASSQTSARSAGAISEVDAVIKAVNDRNAADMTPAMRALIAQANDTTARGIADQGRFAKLGEGVNDVQYDANGNVTGGSLNLSERNKVAEYAGALALDATSQIASFGTGVLKALNVVDRGGSVDKAVSDYAAFSKTKTPEEMQLAGTEFNKNFAAAKDPLEALAVIGKTIVNAPGYVAYNVASEIIQEVVQFGFSGGAASTAKLLKAAPGIANKLGVSVNRVMDMMESGGSAADDAYARAKAAGMSDKDAQIASQKALALGAMTTGAISFTPGGNALANQIFSEGAQKLGAKQIAVEGAKVGLKEAGSEGVEAGFIEGGTQKIINPNKDLNWTTITGTGAWESVIGGKTSATLSVADSTISALQDSNLSESQVQSIADSTATTVTNSSSPSDASNTLIEQLQGSGLTEQQSVTVSNEVIGDQILNSTETLNNLGATELDSSQVVATDSEGNQVTLAELLGESATGKTSGNVTVDTSVVIGTNAEGESITLADLNAITSGATTTDTTGDTTATTNVTGDTTGDTTSKAATDITGDTTTITGATAATDITGDTTTDTTGDTLTDILADTTGDTTTDTTTDTTGDTTTDTTGDTTTDTTTDTTGDTTTTTTTDTTEVETTPDEIIDELDDDVVDKVTDLINDPIIDKIISDPPKDPPKPPKNPKVPSKVTGLTWPQSTALAASFGTPQLANVFYYGKDFGSKKQKVSKKGKLEQEEYKALSVTKAGAEGEKIEEEELARKDKTDENDVEELLKKIEGSSDNAATPEEIEQIVRQGA